jgi:hypothetical protein
MLTGEETKFGSPYTNITSITYSSNGKFLNATLWLSSLKGLTLLHGKPSARLIDYGVMIDSDLNPTTGLEGIDYILDIQWNNTSQTWT